MPAYLSVSSLEQSLGLSRETLATYNPALLPAIWTGKKYVPRGFTLRLPESVSSSEADSRLADIAGSERRSAQVCGSFPEDTQGAER